MSSWLCDELVESCSCVCCQLSRAKAEIVRLEGLMFWREDEDALPTYGDEAYPAKWKEIEAVIARHKLTGSE